MANLPESYFQAPRRYPGTPKYDKDYIRGHPSRATGIDHALKSALSADAGDHGGERWGELLAGAGRGADSGGYPDDEAYLSGFRRITIPTALAALRGLKDTRDLADVADTAFKGPPDLAETKKAGHEAVMAARKLGARWKYVIRPFTDKNGMGRAQLMVVPSGTKVGRAAGKRAEGVYHHRNVDLVEISAEEARKMAGGRQGLDAIILNSIVHNPTTYRHQVIAKQQRDSKKRFQELGGNSSSPKPIKHSDSPFQGMTQAQLDKLVPR